MEQAEKNIVDELARGEILLFLRKVYPEAATVWTLRYYLQERGYRVDGKAFDFHVRYLAEAGFVTFELFREGLGEPERIRLLKLTKAGIDQADGRPKGASGVRF